MKKIDTFNIFQPQPFVYNLIIDSINCYGDFTQAEINIWGGTQPYTYNWVGLTGNGPHTVTPNYSRYYKVSVTDSFNCVSDYDSVLVALNTPLIINTSLDTIVCPYDSLDIGVTVLGGNGGPYNYSWSSPSGSMLGSQSSMPVSPISSNSYY